MSSSGSMRCRFAALAAAACMAPAANASFHTFQIDEIVVFSPLDQANIASIARIQLKGLEERLRKLEIKLDVTDEALKAVAQAGFDPVYGARPLKRAIQQQIENPLAKEILAGHYGPGDTVHVREQRGEIVFTKA